MGIQDQFNEAIEEYLIANEMAPTAFGIKFNGNPNFVADLRKGRSTNSKTIDAAMEWMNDN